MGEKIDHFAAEAFGPVAAGTGAGLLVEALAKTTERWEPGKALLTIGLFAAAAFAAFRAAHRADHLAGEQGHRKTFEDIGE